jgi:hypothetical protein
VGRSAGRGWEAWGVGGVGGEGGKWGGGDGGMCGQVIGNTFVCNQGGKSIG